MPQEDYQLRHCDYCYQKKDWYYYKEGRSTDKNVRNDNGVPKQSEPQA